MKSSSSLNMVPKIAMIVMPEHRTLILKTVKETKSPIQMIQHLHSSCVLWLKVIFILLQETNCENCCSDNS